ASPSAPRGVAPRGSSPYVAPLPFSRYAPVAQLDRAPDYESGGRRFESFRARHYLLNCQLVGPLVQVRAMRAHVLLPLLTLAGCASGNAPPSLLPRAGEAIDPRVAVVRPMNDRPVDPALAARLAALITQAHVGDDAFQPAAAEAGRLAAAAGERQSESWGGGQESLSAAVAA